MFQEGTFWTRETKKAYSERISYILENESPKIKNFQEGTFWAQKIKKTSLNKVFQVAKLKNVYSRMTAD